MKPAKMNFITKLGIKHAGIDSLVKSVASAAHYASPLIGQINI